MRLSAVQKDTLFILHAIEVRGRSNPVPGVKILQMINSARSDAVHGNNFRKSCSTLVEHGFLSKFRSASLQLAFKLTDVGRAKASDIYLERLEEDTPINN